MMILHVLMLYPDTVSCESTPSFPTCNSRGRRANLSGDIKVVDGTSFTLSPYAAEVWETSIAIPASSICLSILEAEAAAGFLYMSSLSESSAISGTGSPCKPTTLWGKNELLALICLLPIHCARASSSARRFLHISSYSISRSRR
ncbi:hypothetical protein KC19_VG266100 [Ceratodon purpureus]|uniref:Uncharacterized protein n=1 Tax=Ceratodon purpureus TaxID=3225 RepID=A0A8T0HUU3_CERPU|nr:hypothetical protein KC19_VG266100 [Ceratodon purpureus]